MRTARWEGRCGTCGAWGTVEGAPAERSARKRGASADALPEPIALSQFKDVAEARRPTGVS
ncbi:MAG: DNA repair protein RadA, partial [Planctomycetota bacterium]